MDQEIGAKMAWTFRITEEFEGNTFEISEMDGSRIHDTVSGTRLRKFIFRDPDLVPSNSKRIDKGKQSIQ